MNKFIRTIAVSAFAVSAVADTRPSEQAGEEWRFEVAADAQKVVSCRVDAKWKERMATHDLVAVGEDGRETPVDWTLDESCETPELVWRAEGKTQFRLRAKENLSVATERDPPMTDLTVDETGGTTIRISNSFFSL